MQEMQKGGEFFTPSSHRQTDRRDHRTLSRPHPRPGLRLRRHVRPVARDFVRAHQQAPATELSILRHGERPRDACGSRKMNLAVHGLPAARSREANTYYEDPFHDASASSISSWPIRRSTSMASTRRRTRSRATGRFPFGLPKPDNANYLWIRDYSSRALNDTGRAGFVMANSAARRALLRTRHPPAADRDGQAVDVHGLGRPEFLLHRHPALHAVVPRQGQGEDGAQGHRCCSSTPGTMFRQIDRAHRDFTPEQIELLANIVRLWRGEATELIHNSYALLDERGLAKDLCRRSRPVQSGEP